MLGKVPHPRNTSIDTMETQPVEEYKNLDIPEIDPEDMLLGQFIPNPLVSFVGVTLPLKLPLQGRSVACFLA